MRLIPVLVALTFMSGCLCCSSIPGGGATTSTQDDYPGMTYSTPTHPTSTVAAPITSTTMLAATTSSMLAPTTSTTTSTSTTESSTSSSTTLATTTTTLYSFDLESLVIQLAGCDDDFYGDAMVAGYITNPTSQAAKNVIVVTELQDTGRDVVEGGEKTLLMEELPADSSLKFRVVYEKPPAWKYCRAYVRT